MKKDFITAVNICSVHVILTSVKLMDFNFLLLVLEKGQGKCLHFQRDDGIPLEASTLA